MNEIYSELRYVPKTMLGRVKGTGLPAQFAEQRVVKVESIPPSMRREGSEADNAVAKGLIVVAVHLESGTIRYFGTTHAHIDGHLRMVIAVSPKDEVLSKWEKVRTESDKPGLIIEICPAMGNASPCLPNGKEVSEDEDIAGHLADCRRSGDCQPACEYVRDHIGVEFRIVARNAQGEYENRLATAEEKAQTCREIYFDSESDFDDEENAEIYLIWQAANEAEQQD